MEGVGGPSHHGPVFGRPHAICLVLERVRNDGEDKLCHWIICEILFKCLCTSNQFVSSSPIQTESGQTEALMEKDPAEKTGDYMHGRSLKTSDSLWGIYLSLSGVFLRQAHICPPVFRAPLHPEANQQQSQGSHSFRRWVTALPWSTSQQTMGSWSQLWKELFRLFLPHVWYWLLSYRGILSRNTIGKLLH